ncbi:unnamed protein product [Fraxinus pennsylvanica]|uniref:BSD domain-containing protein n=1 Tax=Fraxinus pennsylvanica TaxID=56036 RepID=A0AAD1YMG4_9LAMI|nr:unnamed protein product [Fraxinus pennsylvanica]
MDFWQRARSFAEEAAKRSQELTQGIGSTNFSDVVTEASKRSKELAAEVSIKSKEIAVEASKKSKEIAAEASKKSKEIADQIKFQIPPVAVSALTNLVESTQKGNEVDLEKYGVTDELRQFVKGITLQTFQDFPLEDDSEMSDIPTVSNIRQDLTEWQATHAKFMLSTVKEISKLRYELCPRVMKERKFWRIYFVLVNSHVTPYEKGYMDEVKLKSAEKMYFFSETLRTVTMVQMVVMMDLTMILTRYSLSSYDSVEDEKGQQAKVITVTELIMLILLTILENTTLLKGGPFQMLNKNTASGKKIASNRCEICWSRTLVFDKWIPAPSHWEFPGGEVGTMFIICCPCPDYLANWGIPVPSVLGNAG